MRKTIATFTLVTLALLLTITTKSEIKVGLLFTGDSYPAAYSVEQGYFRKEKVTVKLINFMSAQERDAAFQAGAIDAMHSDLIGASLLYQKQASLQVVALLLGDAQDQRVSAIVSAQGSGVHKLQDLQDNPNLSLALSLNTVIEYMTDRTLESHGVDPRRVKKLSVPNIPLRKQLVENGQVAAAFLPEPLAAAAELKKMKVLADDKNQFFSMPFLFFEKIHCKSILLKSNNIYELIFRL